MRYFLTLIAIILTHVLVHGQIFKSYSIEKISQNQAMGKIAGFSPKGDYLLLTSSTNAGLYMLDLSTKETDRLTDEEGAGFNPQISENGNEIIYRSTYFSKEKERLHQIKKIKQSGEFEVLEESLKDGVYGFKKNDSYTLSAQKDLNIDLKNSTYSKVSPIVFTKDLAINIIAEGKIKFIYPNGKNNRYIWVSLSPDNTKILYYVSGEGAYVCNLKGENKQFISHDCRAPKWYNNDIIVGMADIDDGCRLLGSCIVAYTLDGKMQELTHPSSNTIYPFCCSDTKTIACSNVNGEIYTIHINE